MAKIHRETQAGRLPVLALSQVALLIPSDLVGKPYTTSARKRDAQGYTKGEDEEFPPAPRAKEAWAHLLRAHGHPR
eukprot:8127135-Lingulodinium_polyedra.AAC.1